jgi:hypothetical protein
VIVISEYYMAYACAMSFGNVAVKMRNVSISP